MAAELSAPDPSRPFFSIAALETFRITRWADGPDDCGASMLLDPETQSLDGRIPTALCTVLADSALGTVARFAGSGQPVTTSSLTLDYAVEELPASGEITCTARNVIKRGEHLLNTGELRHPEVGLVGVASAWFVLLDSFTLADDEIAAALEADEPVADPGPGLPQTPLGRLLGVRRVEVDGTRATVSLQVSARLCNRYGDVHGGVGALIAELAAEAVVAQSGVPRRPLTATYSYWRRAGRIGAEVTATAELIRDGRRIAVAQGEVLTEDGRAALRATTTTARTTG